MNRPDDGGVRQTFSDWMKLCTTGVGGLSDLPSTKTTIGKHERVSRR
jgi:hypothetical protein